jgi:hypothetical protein
MGSEKIFFHDPFCYNLKFESPHGNVKKSIIVTNNFARYSEREIAEVQRNILARALFAWANM